MSAPDLILIALAMLGGAIVGSLAGVALVWLVICLFDRWDQSR